MTPNEFFAKFAPACQAAMRKNGQWASVRLAQIALETGYGDATPKDIDTGRESYNLSGVKGEGPAGSVRSWTQEYDKQRGWYSEVATFRAYHSFDEHIIERDRIFLDWPDNYGAYLTSRTPEEACMALQNAPESYASDPQYGPKLIAIIEANDLKRFDEGVRQSVVDKPFSDVNPDDWFTDDLVTLKAMGIIHGRPDGTFAPNESITRAEAAHLIRLAIRYVTGK